MPTTYQIIAAPFEVWIAPTGTAFPAVNQAPGAGWTKLGTSGKDDITDDGVKVTHNQKIELLKTQTGPRKASRTDEGLTIEFNLVDLTLEQYAIALNQATITNVAAGTGTPGYKKINLAQGLDTVAVHALLVRGPSPYGIGNMQYEVPMVYQNGEPEITYKPGELAALHFEFVALRDTSQPAGEEFGHLIEQTAAPL